MKTKKKIKRTSKAAKQPKKKSKARKKNRTKTEKINALHSYSPLMATAQSQTRAGAMVSRATMSVKLDFPKHLPFPALVPQVG
jgi:hypothetical protein